MTRTLFIPDTHGDGSAALRLMRTVGALDENLERVPGWKVIHLGDLIDGRRRTRAADDFALTLVEDGIIDILLVGNHEYPFLGGNGFDGFVADPYISARLLRLEKLSKLRVAYAHGDTLVTHAGLTPGWQRRLGTRTAYDTAKRLNMLWKADPLHRVFADVGFARGGIRPTGGILWSDYNDELRYLGFNQLHGHTMAGVDATISPVSGKRATVIDNGGGKGQRSLAGAIAEGNSLEIVYGESAPAFLTPLFDLVEAA